MDALTHAIEGLITKGAWEMSDMFHLEAIRLISANLRDAVKNDPDGRKGMALGQYIAGMGFSNVGLGIVHSMAHGLSALYDTPHGVACAIILPTGLEYNKEYSGEKYKALAKAMGVEGVDAMTQEEYRTAAINAVKKLSADVGIPADLKGILKEEDVNFSPERLCRCLPPRQPQGYERRRYDGAVPETDVNKKLPKPLGIRKYSQGLCTFSEFQHIAERLDISVGSFLHIGFGSHTEQRLRAGETADDPASVLDVNAVLAGDVAAHGHAAGRLAADDRAGLAHLRGDPLEADRHLVALLPQSRGDAVEQAGGGVVAYARPFPAAVLHKIVVEQHKQLVRVDELPFVIDDARDGRRRRRSQCRDRSAGRARARRAA